MQILIFSPKKTQMQILHLTFVLNLILNLQNVILSFFSTTFKIILASVSNHLRLVNTAQYIYIVFFAVLLGIKSRFLKLSKIGRQS